LCASAMRHIDEQNWMWGSFLFGGTLAATGFVLSQKVGWIRLCGLSLVASVILIGYLLYVNRGMRVNKVFRERMCQIEELHLPMIWTERIFERAKDKDHPMISRQGKNISLATWFTDFHILELMVTGYLLILWIGTIISLLLSKGFL